MSCVHHQLYHLYFHHLRHLGGNSCSKESNKNGKIQVIFADKCQVGIFYAIGKAEPVSVSVETFGTSEMSEEELVKMVRDTFDLRPAAIIEAFDLKNPIYKKTSAYGHFNSPNFPWESREDVFVPLK